MAVLRRRTWGQRSKRAQRRRKRFFVIGSIFCVGAVFVVGGLAYLAHRPEFHINEIIVSGNEVITDEDVVYTINRTVSGKYLFLFPKKNFMLFPQGGAERALQEVFPRIADVTLSLQSLHTLLVTITERQPYALWCSEFSPDAESMTPPCYFLDADGLIFARAPEFTGNVFFIFRGAIQDSQPIGIRYLEQDDEFARMNAFVGAVRELGFSPVALRIVDAVDNELYMEDDSYFIFSRMQNSSELVTNLQSILSLPEFHEEGKRLDYIDLRFGNKVYYKFE